MALLVVGWLNLALQPCMAGAVSLPVGMEHCDHGGTPEHPAICPAMQAAETAASHDLNADALRYPAAARPGAMLTMVPTPSPADPPCHAPAPGARHPTGPPLNIRFCTLRN